MDFYSLDRLISAFWQILPYVSVTLQFVLITTAISTVLAVVVAVLRIRNIRIVNFITEIYISYMRGVPLLVQLMVVYYGFPLLINALFHINIIRWNGMIFAVIAMVMNESAYMSESMRGAILSVSKTQSEAGYSIGMTWGQTFLRIILPQAVRVYIPSYGTSLIGILKSTSMLYTIGVIEIVQRTKSIGAATGHFFEGYTVCALFYIVLCLLIKSGFQLLEKKMRYGRG